MLTVPRGPWGLQTSLFSMAGVLTYPRSPLLPVQMKVKRPPVLQHTERGQRDEGWLPCLPPNHPCPQGHLSAWGQWGPLPAPATFLGSREALPGPKNIWNRFHGLDSSFPQLEMGLSPSGWEAGGSDLSPAGRTARRVLPAWPVWTGSRLGWKFSASSGGSSGQEMEVDQGGPLQAWPSARGSHMPP